MTRALTEEIILALWTISAILAFGFGFNTFGWILSVKAISDLIGAVICSWKEIK